MNGQTRWAAVGVLTLALVLPAGCNTMKPALPKSEDVSQTRCERNAETLQEFDKQREYAEFQAAQALWAEGRHEECCRRLDSLLKHTPDHLDARLLLADVLAAANRPQEALEVLQPALEAHPDDARVQYGVALLLDVTGQRRGAEAHYEEAVKLEPKNEVYQVSYQQLVAAETSSESSSLPPVPQLPPKRVQLSAGPKASARLTTAEDASRRERTDFAEQSDPEVPTTPTASNDLLAQGGQALTEGNTPAALACFQRAMADRPDDPQIPISAAVAALRYNHPDVAIELLEPATRRFPDSASLQRILGTAYYRRGDYRSSQVALQQALSLDKSNALSYFLMGCTQVKLGETEAAERCFRQAQLLDPKYTARR
jgi:tetratricopeptide (TPR) repeat protein